MKRPRSPAALTKPLTSPAEPKPDAPAPPPFPAPKTDAEAVARCLEILKANKVTLKDGNPVTRESLPTAVLDVLALAIRSRAEADQLRATLKNVL